MAKNERMIAALLRERAGLVGQGKENRVAQVDEQLKHYGYESGEKTAEVPVERADPKKQAPQGRSAQPKQQTKD